MDIESLCCLLKLIGKEIDRASNATKMKSYFDDLEQIVEERDISDKVLLMILGLIELRKNGWISRKNAIFEKVSLHSSTLNRDPYTMKHSEPKAYTLDDITEIVCETQGGNDSQGIANSLLVLGKFNPSEESQYIEFIKIGLKIVLIN